MALRSRLTFILPIILLFGTATPSTVPQERVTLDGTWLVTSLSLNGQVFGGDGSELLITIVGDSYEQAVDGNVNERGTIKVDLSKKPIAIDFVITEGFAQTTTQLGIAEMSGRTLKLHLNQPGANGRPVDFNPLADHMLIIATKK